MNVEFKDTELTEEAKANGTFMVMKVDGKDVAVTGQMAVSMQPAK